MRAANNAVVRAGPVNLQAAADAFLSSTRCQNAKTCRAYAAVIVCR